MTPIFQIAVREKNGESQLFRLQHAEVTDIDAARELVKAEFQDAQVILISTNARKAQHED